MFAQGSQDLLCLWRSQDVRADITGSDSSVCVLWFSFFQSEE